MKSIIKSILVIGLLIISTNTAIAKTQKVKVKTLHDYIHKHCKNNCIDSHLFRSQIKLASHKHHISEKLLMAVVKVESRFNKRAHSKGNYGLMQVNASSHRDKLKYKDRFDIVRNIDIGSEILSECLESSRNNIKRALSCYKGGYSAEYQNEIKLAMVTMAQLSM